MSSFILSSSTWGAAGEVFTAGLPGCPPAPGPGSQGAPCWNHCPPTPGLGSHGCPPLESLSPSPGACSHGCPCWNHCPQTPGPAPMGAPCWSHCPPGTGPGSCPFAWCDPRPLLLAAPSRLPGSHLCARCTTSRVCALFLLFLWVISRRQEWGCSPDPQSPNCEFSI